MSTEPQSQTTTADRIPWPRTLIELCAANDGALRQWSSYSGFVRTRLICGERADRSKARLDKLVTLGLAEGKRPPGGREWTWRVTDAGRAAVKELQDVG